MLESLPSATLHWLVAGSFATDGASAGPGAGFAGSGAARCSLDGVRAVNREPVAAGDTTGVNLAVTRPSAVAEHLSRRGRRRNAGWQVKGAGHVGLSFGPIGRAVGAWRPPAVLQRFRRLESLQAQERCCWRRAAQSLAFSSLAGAGAGAVSASALRHATAALRARFAAWSLQPPQGCASALLSVEPAGLLLHHLLLRLVRRNCRDGPAFRRLPALRGALCLRDLDGSISASVLARRALHRRHR